MPPKAALAVASAFSEVREDLVAAEGGAREGLIILAPTQPMSCSRRLAAKLLGREAAQSKGRSSSNSFVSQ
jgi:hypothetical protein